jgi:hypothetical protein
MSKTMEKEITAANRNGMKKRYQMYADAASKLAEKTESREKKGDRK